MHREDSLFYFLIKSNNKMLNLRKFFQNMSELEFSRMKSKKKSIHFREMKKKEITFLRFTIE